MKVAPSILGADFLHLEKDINLVNSAADWAHLDIMDGTFVPNISFGFPVVEHIGRICTIPMDAHLMVVHPERWFETLKKLGCSYVSFHLEAAGCRTGKYIKAIHKLGMKAGVAIDPDVPVEKLYKYIGKADFFLIMSVFAGFGGQKFIYEAVDRIIALRAQIKAKGADTLIEVDGGVNTQNAVALKEAGADILVAGSAVFKAEDPAAYIKELQSI